MTPPFSAFELMRLTHINGLIEGLKYMAKDAMENSREDHLVEMAGKLGFSKTKPQLVFISIVKYLDQIAGWDSVEGRTEIKEAVLELAEAMNIDAGKTLGDSFIWATRH